MLKVLKKSQLQTYHVAHRVLSLSGDIEENRVHHINTYLSHSNLAVTLLESWLSTLNRTALDVGGGGGCFFEILPCCLFLMFNQ